MDLDQFNGLRATDAAALLLECCHSERWAAAVAAGRPFESLDDLLGAARQAWQTVDDSDRLQAFAAHPLIGDVELLRRRFNDTANREQGQVLAASEATLSELAELNHRYRDRHGFIFIICATGQSAEAMLDALRQRLPRSTAEEIEAAAAEQAAITELRLQKVFS